MQLAVGCRRGTRWFLGANQEEGSDGMFGGGCTALFSSLVIVVVYLSSAHSRQDVIGLITGRVHDFTSNQTAAAAAAVSMETEVAECHAKRLYFTRGKPHTKARRLFGKCHKCGFGREI